MHKIVQNTLHNIYPAKFPYGHRGTVVAEVVCEMLKLDNGAEIYTECLICNVCVKAHKIISFIINPI